MSIQEERQRILSVLREFDAFLLAEARSEFGKILAEVEEPEIVELSLT